MNVLGYSSISLSKQAHYRLAMHKAENKVIASFGLRTEQRTTLMLEERARKGESTLLTEKDRQENHPGYSPAASCRNSDREPAIKRG
jgi:hypothetical protein